MKNLVKILVEDVIIEELLIDYDEGLQEGFLHTDITNELATKASFYSTTHLVDVVNHLSFKLGRLRRKDVLFKNLQNKIKLYERLHKKANSGFYL